MLGSPCVAEPSVRWLAPAECPQAGDFNAALHEQLKAESRRQLVTSIDGQIKHATKHGYSLSLSVATQGQTARRVLSAETCTELLEAAVWLVVLALGPAAEPPPSARETDAQHAKAPATPTAHGQREAAGEGPPSSGDEHDTPAASSAAAALTVPAKAAQQSASANEQAAHATESAQRGATGDDSPRDRAPSALHARVAGVFGIAAGAGADVQGTLGVRADLSFGILHTQVSFTGLLPATESVMGGGHSEVWSLALGLSECALWGQRVHAGPCLGVEGLRTAAHSQDFGGDVKQSVLWASVDLGLQLLWPLTKSLELNFSGSIGIPITPRPRFTVAGVGVVASAEPWSQQAQLGLIYLAH
jgi:hypothetical protein